MLSEIHFLLTYRCNFACTICYLQDLDNNESFDGFAFAEEYAKARQ